MIPITCQSCGFPNEHTQVFCHQCGVRLDRPRDEPKPVEKNPPTPKPTPQSTPQSRRKRKRQLKIQSEPWSITLVASVLKISIFAAIWAMFLLALRAPTDLPPLPSSNPELSQALQKRYLEAIDPSPFPHQLIMTSEELNALLATEVSIKQTGIIQMAGGKPQPFVVLQPQAFTLGMAIPMIGQQLVFESEFAVENRPPGKPSFKLIRGNIGHLPVAPFVMDKAVRWHHAFGAAFSIQLKKIQEADQVLIGSDNVQITWPADS